MTKPMQKKKNPMQPWEKDLLKLIFVTEDEWPKLKKFIINRETVKIDEILALIHDYSDKVIFDGCEEMDDVYIGRLAALYDIEKLIRDSRIKKDKKDTRK